MSGLLTGKTGVVMGVSNKYGFAWAIASAAAEHGARVAITYQDERLGRRARELLELYPERITLALECDVASDEAIERALAEAGQHLGGVDFLVHSIAFANREELQGEFIRTSRAGFALAHDISVYSLVAACRAARPFLRPGASVLTLTFEGSRRVFPNYNVMGVAKAALESAVRYLAHDLGPSGVRVNAISAGPVKTLAASAVKGFSQIEEIVEQRAPLRRNIDTRDVADVAVFLLSDMARAVTGEIVHVDAGFHVMGI